MSATPASNPTPTTNPTPTPAATPDINEVLTAVKTLAESQTQLKTQLETLAKEANEARTKAPWARRGENILGSRGFQLSRVAGVACKKLEAENAKIEIELCSRLQKEYVERGFYQKQEANSVVVPLSSELMCTSGAGMERLAEEAGQLLAAGVSGADPEEMQQISRQFYGARQRTLGWQDQSGLGALVGPPIVGEPIQLLRNEEVFMRAGARTIPFPPSGRAMWPRFTGATTAEWVGTGASNREATSSEPATGGDVVLQVKKLGVRVRIPNELFRFPTVSVEQIIRSDMMLSAALKMDKSFLEAVGSQVEPKGIINYDNILKFTVGTGGVGTDGNVLQPEDILKAIGTVEEKNITFNNWVMRPLMYAAIGNRRADSVNAGDSKGQFLFNTLRDMQPSNVNATNNSVGQLEGYPVQKSNQISSTRSKGAANNLTYILAGDFTKYLIAMSGVMEFAVATQGDAIFASDQSEIRMFTWADGAPIYEEAFLLIDQLVVA